MKKSLLALALLAATGAYAQSVTLYGVADVAYNNDVKKDTAGKKNRNQQPDHQRRFHQPFGFQGRARYRAGLESQFRDGI